MTTAVRHVHWRNGVWNTNGGWELHAIVVAALAALAETGPGPLSLDHALGLELRGAPVTIAALGAGVAGSYATSRIAARATAHADSDEPLTAARTA
jgi:putative oxidoreductase